MGKRHLVVVELDGTLVQGNTLHEFMRLGLRHNLRRGRIIPSLNIIWLMLLRRLKLISHTKFKYNVLEEIEITNEIQHAFKAKITSKINPDVKRLINDFHEEGADILLATAAPDTYISWICLL